MSKINIYFNDKVYLVNDESFSSASADLQSHLSNVMNGSGAMINFKGTSYNIDSTKLSNVTNDFISYLGTIVGNGRKVVVNGVEYSIDSTKLANAISELETVLGNSNSGDSDGLNEYGFYFDTQYAYTNDTGGVFTFIFHEDGSAEMYGNGELQGQVPAGMIVYENNKAVAEALGMSVEFSNNGVNCSISGESEVYTAISEEYCGYYFGQKYTNVNDEGVKQTYIFYADGYAEYYENDILQMTTKTENIVPCFGKDILYFGVPGSSNFVGITFENSGTRAVLKLIGDPIYYDLEVENDSDGLNEYGFYFNRPYKSEIMNFDGVDVRMVFTFYKNGDANMKIEGVDGTIYTEELASNGCKYEQDKIILLTDSGNDELMISNNGKTLSGVDMVLSLDESYNLALNEYGFYFNNRYSYTDDDTYFHVTFYNDGNTTTVYDFTPSGGNVHNYMGTWSINANGELEVQFDNNSNSIKTVNISNNGETLSWVLEDSSVENTVVNLEK